MPRAWLEEYRRSRRLLRAEKRRNPRPQARRMSANQSADKNQSSIDRQIRQNRIHFFPFTISRFHERLRRLRDDNKPVRTGNAKDGANFSGGKEG
jgi:hypothetical protein